MFKRQFSAILLLRIIALKLVKNGRYDFLLNNTISKKPITFIKFYLSKNDGILLLLYSYFTFTIYIIASTQHTRNITKLLEPKGHRLIFDNWMRALLLAFLDGNFYFYKFISNQILRTLYYLKNNYYQKVYHSNFSHNNKTKIKKWFITFKIRNTIKI